ncbi:hypothetical protein NA78x_000955 [Anatilimnocola sp. NA78]|uniref:hypothetical protein n=1 Tax=Anatilimnocola sp. NA78 TaxID=3415683 RepID=UPI003CE4D00B
MAGKTESFDPYQHWLGIPPTARPLHHYLLLGLNTFEADAAKISAAADERMKLIRQYQAGPRGSHTNKLLNELATARICLLSPASKAVYDQSLHQALFPTVPEAAAPPPRRRKLEEVMPPGWTGNEPPAVMAPPQPQQYETPPQYSQPFDEPHEPAETRTKSPLMTVAGLGALILLIAVLGGVAVWISGSSVRNERDVAGRPIGDEVDPSTEKEPVVEQPAEPPKVEPAAPKGVMLMQEGSGEVNLSPSTAVLSGQVQREVVGTSDVLSQWSSPTDVAEWNFSLVKPGFFELELQYTAGVAIRGQQATVQYDQESKRFTLRESDSEGKPVRDSHIIVVKRSGKHTLSFRPEQAWPAGAMQLIGIRLVPAVNQ